MPTVVVVDDDVEILNVVSIILELNQYNVVQLSDTYNIIEIVNKERPAAVLLDVQLSGFDGRIVCRQIKEMEENKHIPVILFSANQRYRDGLEEYLCDDFIEKPFDLNELVAIVDKHTFVKR